MMPSPNSSEFFLDQRLHRGAIDVHHLIKPVDQRIGRHRGRQRAAIGHGHQKRDFLIREVQAERIARLRRLVLGQRDLPHQRGGGPFLGLADGRGHIGPFDAVESLVRDDLFRQFGTGHFGILLLV